MSKLHKAEPRLLAWEQPLGTVAGYLAEPETGFVDPYEVEERKAIQEVEQEATSKFWAWWHGERKCGKPWKDGDKIIHTCTGRFKVFTFNWCNQINIRCQKCGRSPDHVTTGLRVTGPLAHQSPLTKRILNNLDDRIEEIELSEDRPKEWSVNPEPVEQYWRDKRRGY